MSVVATTGHWFTLRLNWRCSEFACGCGQEFENARDLVHHVQLARGASCWCCAVWGLVTPAEVPDQGGGYALLPLPGLQHIRMQAAPRERSAQSREAARPGHQGGLVNAQTSCGLRVEFLPGRIRFLQLGATEIKPNERPPFGCCLLIWGNP